MSLNIKPSAGVADIFVLTIEADKKDICTSAAGFYTPRK